MAYIRRSHVSLTPMRFALLSLALVALASPNAACQTPAPAHDGVSASPAPSARAAYQAGSAVSILWKGGWYEGHVLEAAVDSFKVGYDGYSDIWDEWVGPDRLRPREVAAAPPAPSPPPATEPAAAPSAPPAPSSGGPPLGKYVCRQYKTTIAYVTLHPGGAYEISGVTGRYDYDAASGDVRWEGGSFDEWGWDGRYEHVRRPAGDGRPDEHVLRLASESDGLRINCYKMAE